MCLWGVGGFLAGKMAAISAISRTTQDVSLIKFEYYHAFFTLSVILSVGVIISLIACMIIKKLVPVIDNAVTMSNLKDLA